MCANVCGPATASRSRLRLDRCCRRNTHGCRRGRSAHDDSHNPANVPLHLRTSSSGRPVLCDRTNLAQSPGIPPASLAGGALLNYGTSCVAFAHLSDQREDASVLSHRGPVQLIGPLLGRFSYRATASQLCPCAVHICTPRSSRRHASPRTYSIQSRPRPRFRAFTKLGSLHLQ